MNYQELNARTIDSWVEGGWEWGKPISHEEYAKALRGEWDVRLTPVKPVPHEWFGDLKGKKLLGLASGGGQQMPVFAALGAECTVLDYSSKQIESERMVAEREGYQIRIIQGDMTKPLPFEDMWREYKRIIKDKHAIVIFALEPFATKLRYSNLKNYKYDWICQISSIF